MRSSKRWPRHDPAGFSESGGGASLNAPGVGRCGRRRPNEEHQNRGRPFQPRDPPVGCLAELDVGRLHTDTGIVGVGESYPNHTAKIARSRRPRRCAREGSDSDRPPLAGSLLSHLMPAVGRGGDAHAYRDQHRAAGRPREGLGLATLQAAGAAEPGRSVVVYRWNRRIAVARHRGRGDGCKYL